MRAEDKIDITRTVIASLRKANEAVPTHGIPANERMKRHALGILSVLDASLDGDVDRMLDIAKTMEMRFQMDF